MKDITLILLIIVITLSEALGQFLLSVSHHNTLKESILANILKAQKKLTKEKFHIANCSCFLLEYTEQGWTFSIVFDGFPDKPKYNYFTGKNKILFGPTKLDSGDDWGMMVSWLNFIQDKKTKNIFWGEGFAPP